MRQSGGKLNLNWIEEIMKVRVLKEDSVGQSNNWTYHESLVKHQIMSHMYASCLK